MVNLNETTKMQNYLAIVKINAKQLINAMVAAKQLDEPNVLADVLDDVINNLIAFNYYNNPLWGDIKNAICCDDDIWEKPNYNFADDDNYICANECIKYVKTLPNHILENWNDIKKYCMLSVKSSNSLLVHIFGEYTTEIAIWNDSKLMGAN